MEKDYIISKNWELSGYINGNNTYIHKDFNLTDDGFYLEMKTYGSDVIIYEESSRKYQIVFQGFLKSNKDLDDIMRLLVYWNA